MRRTFPHKSPTLLFALLVVLFLSSCFLMHSVYRSLAPIARSGKGHPSPIGVDGPLRDRAGFIQDFRAGRASRFRIESLTVEGDKTFTDYIYGGQGNSVLLIKDNRGDRFGPQGVSRYRCRIQVVAGRDIRLTSCTEVKE